MSTIDQSLLLDNILNPNSVNNVRKEEKELFYKQSLKRDWEKAFAEQSNNEHIDYEQSELTEQNNNQSPYQFQGVTDYFQHAAGIKMQNAAEVVTANIAITDYGQNIQQQNMVQLVVEQVMNNFAENQAQTQMALKSEKITVAKAQETAPVTSKSVSSGNLPAEYNVHVAYETDRVKIWLRHANLSESEGLEIFHQVQKLFAEKGIKVSAFYLNGEQLINEQPEPGSNKSIDIDRKINQVL